MFPIIGERDIKIVSFAAGSLGFSTSSTTAAGDDVYMASDGVLNPDFAVAQCKAATVAIIANRITSVGVHMVGPEDSDEYTLYSYNAHAWSTDPQLIPFLYVAVSPASITNNATGDLCEHWSLLGTPDAIGTAFRSMHREGVVALPKTDAVAAGRGVAFGIGFATKGSTAGTLIAFARISVRRLMKNEPSIIDNRKL